MKGSRRVAFLAALSVTFWLTPPRAHAEQTVMVKDLTIPGGLVSHSRPQDLTLLNGVLYFSAADGQTYRYFYRSDGSAAGTWKVKQIIPFYLTVMGGALYFIAADSFYGAELYKSDGTAAGTAMIKDIYPGSLGSFSDSLLALNNTLIFPAWEGVNGKEIWRSDGTAAGTVLLKDIYPGAEHSSPSYLTKVGNNVFFAANDGTRGIELWKTDGTPGGTAMVKDIAPGAGGSNPNFMTDVGGLVYFMANDATYGAELWKSDGTAGGTTLVKDIKPGAGGSAPQGMANINGTLYFRANDGTTGIELWKSDGTAGGTTLVKNIRTGASEDAQPAMMTQFNGAVYFAADDGVNGVELWKTDGTGPGTNLFMDFNPGAGNSFPGGTLNAGFFSLNGSLYFPANNALWKTDGTPGGTVLVSSVWGPDQFLDWNGVLFFTADDYIHGTELWRHGADTPAMTPEPARTAGTQNTVAWSATTGATNYTVQCDGAGNFVAPAQSVSVAPPATSRLFTGLNGGQSYWYRVRAAYAGSVISAWSEPTSSTQDNTPPTLTMSSTAANPTNVNPIPITVTFSEPVTGFDLTDITAAGATKGNFSGSGANYSFTLTPTAQGTVSAAVSAGRVQDLAANANTTGASISRTFDSVAPTVIMTSTAPTPTNVSPIPVTVTLSENSTNFAAGDIVTSGATVQNFTGTGALYSFDLVPSIQQGAVEAAINSGAFSDGAGNASLVAGTFGRVFDSVPPSVLSISRNGPSPTKAGTVAFQVTFSESVTGVATTNFAIDAAGVSGATVLSVNGTGTGRAVNVGTGSGDGSLSIDLNRNIAAIRDTANNPLGNAFTLGQAYTIDRTPPTLTLSSTTPNPTRIAPIPVTATFSEPVIGFTAADVQASSATVANFGGAGLSYSFQLQPASQGFVTAAVPAGMAQDAAGNLNAGSKSLSRFFDDVAPVFGDIAAAPALARPGRDVSISFTASETLATSPTVTVNGNAATTQSHSGLNYTYRYRALASDSDGSATIAITGSDPAGNAGATSTTAALTIDKTPPTATMDSTASDPTRTSPIPVTVTFSEPVTGFTQIDLVTTRSTVANFSGAGAHYAFDLIPAGQGRVAAGIPAGAALDQAGNENAAGATLGRDFDSLAPTVTLASAAPDPTNTSPIPVTVTFNEPVTDFTPDDIVTSGSRVESLTGAGASYHFNLVPEARGRIMAFVAAGAGRDDAGNENVESAPLERVYDSVAPRALGIARADASPTSAATVLYRVVFNEEVSGVDAADFGLATNGISGASITVVTGGPLTYSVRVATGNGNGTLRLGLADDDTIADAAGNRLGGAGLGNGSFNNGEIYLILKPPNAVAPGYWRRWD